MRPHPHPSLWAKLGKVRYPESYHPLLFHLIDVAAVARRLWDHVLRPAIKERFSGSLGLPEDACAPWVAFWVGAHDIGKGSPGFQQRDNTTALVEHLGKEGFQFHASGSAPHGTVSVPVLYRWLEETRVPARIARRIAVAVGGHHGVFPALGWDCLGDA